MLIFNQFNNFRSAPSVKYLGVMIHHNPFFSSFAPNVSESKAEAECTTPRGALAKRRGPHRSMGRRNRIDTINVQPNFGNFTVKKSIIDLHLRKITKIRINTCFFNAFSLFWISLVYFAPNWYSRVSRWSRCGIWNINLK